MLFKTQAFLAKLTRGTNHNGHIRDTIYLGFLPRNDERTALAGTTKASR